MTDSSAAMVAFERAHSIAIEAPATTVLDYVSNPQSWKEWMPATHEMDSEDHPLRAGETFSERWETRKGEVGLDWRVTERIDPTLWQAECETPFTGPIVARYEIEVISPKSCVYTRRIVNPARPKAPTLEMIERMDAEAHVCLDNIKRIVEEAVLR